MAQLLIPGQVSAYVAQHSDITSTQWLCGATCYTAPAGWLCDIVVSRIDVSLLSHDCRYNGCVSSFSKAVSSSMVCYNSSFFIPPPLPMARFLEHSGKRFHSSRRICRYIFYMILPEILPEINLPDSARKGYHVNRKKSEPPWKGGGSTPLTFLQEKIK